MSFGYSVHQFGVDVTLPVLQNLLAWWDPSDDNTITFGTGSDVSQMDDKSGNGNDLSQATASDQPEQVAGTNGLATLEFDGTSEFLDLGDNILAGTVGRTLFFVLNTVSDPHVPIMTLNTNTGNGQAWELTQEIGLRVAGGSYLFNEDSGGVWSVLTIQNAASSNVDDTVGRLNGTAMTKLSGTSRAIDTGTNGTTRLGENIFATKYYDGQLGEIVIYDRELSMTEIESMEDYLMTKWGI